MLILSYNNSGKNSSNRKNKWQAIYVYSTLYKLYAFFAYNGLLKYSYILIETEMLMGIEAI